MSYLSDLRKVQVPNPSGTGSRTVEVVGGSFRGQAFLVSSHQFGSGRRIAAHEFPGKDDPFNEDMGRSARSVTLDAHLIGEDVMDQKLALLDACEQSGRGTLIHPYLGSLNARCASISISENSGEKRYVGISLTFVLDPDISAPAAVTTDNRAAVQTKATAATATTTTKVTAGAKAFSLASATKATINSAVAATNKLLDEVEAARTTMRNASAYIAKLGTIRANLELLVMAPSDFAARVQDLVTTTENATLPSGKEPTTASEEAWLLRLMAEEGITMAAAGASITAKPTGTTKAKADQQRNTEALLSLFRETALWDLARKLIGARIDSVQDSNDLQERIQDAFDTVLSNADDPTTYQSAQDVLSACLTYLRRTSADLATIEHVTLARTVPSLVMAYETYGDTGRADDIISRNGIEHPGFVPGGIPLEVLSK